MLMLLLKGFSVWCVCFEMVVESTDPIVPESVCVPAPDGALVYACHPLYSGDSVKLALKYAQHCSTTN